MTYLSHTASFHSSERIAPSNRRIKHLAVRANGTLQERLVKAMRLAGISSLDDANAFLTSYVAPHNARFACTPADPRDVHRPLAVHSPMAA
ncbi:hypothetical protein ACMGDM_16450 [Sphingomonas sp. DT-51]